MGSEGNSNQWQPYETYRDCSLEICSIYCPQWCYLIFPPPPPFGYRYSTDSSTDFSPLIIAIIGILASAFILVSYYTIISKYCRNRANRSRMDENVDQVNHENHQQAPCAGLDEAIIKSITVCKYKRGDGLVEGTDCSVCLSEFEESESLRLLPKCSHAFHLPCIDMWLKSHSTCPLCRSNISPANLSPPASQEIQRTEGLNVSISALQYQHRSNDTVIVVHDLQDATVSRETAGSGLENGVSLKNSRELCSNAQDCQSGDSMIEVREGVIQPNRSVTLNSSYGNVSVADILRASEDSEEEIEEDELPMGIGPSNQEPAQIRYKSGVLNSPGKGKSCIIPK